MYVDDPRILYRDLLDKLPDFRYPCLQGLLFLRQYHHTSIQLGVAHVRQQPVKDIVLLLVDFLHVLFHDQQSVPA